MRMLRMHILRNSLLLLLVALIVFPSTAVAQLGVGQEQISEAQWRRGFHGFNMIAEGNDLERISVEQFRSSQPSDVLLVVIGNLRNLPVHVTNHVNNGGSALLASDSSVPRYDVTFAGFGFRRMTSYPRNDPSAFRGMHDCPIVSDFQPHPILSGVAEIVTNRPGYVTASRRKTLASLPSTYWGRTAGAFIAAREHRNGGRAVVVGDQSIFTNQMILFGDNAIFANQAIKWLKNGQPKKMLILVNGSEHSTLNPADVVVDLPPPSTDDVMEALENLPPSAMLDFANSVATVVEDEGMINDFIHDTVDKIPQRDLSRFFIFLMFGVACFTFVAAFLFQGKLQRQTASEVAFKQSGRERDELKVVQMRERQQAAHMLLDRFCVLQAGRRFGDWPSFPTGLRVESDRESKSIFESMTKASILYRSKQSSFWTRKRLANLEKTVQKWQTYFDARPELEVDAELVQSNNAWPTDPLSNEFN